MDRLTWRALVRALLWAFLAAASAWAFHVSFGHHALGRVVEVLRAANLGLLIGLGPLVLASSFLLRAARFRTLVRLDHGKHPAFSEVLASVVVSQGANNVLPLRAGELVRTRDFVKRGVPLFRVAIAQALEKAVEFTSLLAWIALGARPLFARLRPALLLAVGVATLIAVATWFVIASRRSRTTFGLLARRGELVSLAFSLVWSLLADSAEIALIAVCLASLGIVPTLAMAVTVLASVNVAIALPSTPGHVGTLEAGATVGLVLVGVPSEIVLGFALVYRLVQWLPITIAAGILWLLRGSPRSAARSLQSGGV